MIKTVHTPYSQSIAAGVTVVLSIFGIYGCIKDLSTAPVLCIPLTALIIFTWAFTPIIFPLYIHLDNNTREYRIDQHFRSIEIKSHGHFDDILGIRCWRNPNDSATTYPIAVVFSRHSRIICISNATSFSASMEFAYDVAGYLKMPVYSHMHWNGKEWVDLVEFNKDTMNGDMNSNSGGQSNSRSPIIRS